MMYSVIDLANTIIVSRDGNEFVIERLSTREKVLMDSYKFHGGSFKYESEFLHKFAIAFGDKKGHNIILSTGAAQLMTDLIYFNRVDN